MFREDPLDCLVAFPIIPDAMIVGVRLRRTASRRPNEVMTGDIADCEVENGVL